MATLAVAVANKRKKNLTVLGGVTALFVVLAVVSVYERASELAPKFAPRNFFPGLTTTVNNLGEMAIAAKNASIHVKLAGGKWTVQERNGYPADEMQMRAVAVGMADLQTLEPKTARADWLKYIGLEAPPQGDAVRVTLTDTGGKVLADLLVGQMQGMPDELGRSTLYVRKPDENQSYLARGYLAIKPQISDWLNKAVVVIARDRVKGAVVTPAMGPSYTLSRDNKDQQDFKLLDLPKGRSLSFEGSPDGVAGAITGFDFDDVAKADGIDFTKAPQQVANTFDGLNITVKVANKGMEHWASVSAEGTNDMTKMEAEKINAAVMGWAFKISDMKMGQFVANRETLLKPPDQK